MNYQMTVTLIKSRLTGYSNVYREDKQGNRVRLTKKAFREEMKPMNNYSWLAAYRENDGDKVNLILGDKRNPNARIPSHPDCFA